MDDQPSPIHFPVCGIDVTTPFGDQRPAPLPEGDDDDGAPYGRTCAKAVNVRGYEASTMRRRGGTRPGLVKYVPQAVGGITDWLVQELATVTISGSVAVHN